MDQIAEEIFNIIKGADFNVLMFTASGTRTLDVEDANRFYLTDADVMISLRLEDNKTELVVQAGKDFDILANKKFMSSLKATIHKYMGEFTLKRFDKNIKPKDFSHQSVSEGFSKAFGSLKTSYVQLPTTKVIIKHKNGVNEEKRGARSRNIHSLFIETADKQRQQFPYRYLSGAKAMAMHVENGGTFDDAKGVAILEMCKEAIELSQFLTHVRKNKLVNESNANVVEACKSKIKKIKECIRGLQTSKGYNNFEASQEVNEENSENQLDIAGQFLYNTFETVDMDSVLSTVSRVVQEREGKENMGKEAIADIYNMIKSGADLKISIDPNDPEHPNNEDQVKYSGPQGPMAKISSMLSFIAKSSKNDELFNVLSRLSTEIHDMKRDDVILVAKVVNYLTKLGTQEKAEESVEPTESITESVINDLRKKIA